MGYTYLISPYSHPDPTVRKERYENACCAAGVLMKKGYKIFSPIAHSHAIEQFFDRIEGFAFWMAQDKPFFDAAKDAIVLTLPGWKESKGVAKEIQWAVQQNKTVTYYDMINIYEARISHA